jgi:recombination protein RecT
MSDKKPATLKDFIEANLPAKIKDVLPKEMDLNRFMRIAFAAMVRNPELNNCTPFSVMEALIRCSECGVEPDGRMAYLVPFRQYKDGKLVRTNCTFILGYMGMVQICRRTREVADIQCEVVYEKDDFDYQFGSNKFLRHRPYDGPGDPGKIIHVWSYVNFVNGFQDFRVWRKDKIDEIRKRSKTSDKGPWVSDYPAMAKKSIFREHFKWLPFSSETIQKVTNDDDYIDVEGQVVEPKRLRGRQPKPFAETDGFGDAGEAPEEEPTPATNGRAEPVDSDSAPELEEGNPFDEPLPEHKKPLGTLFK